MINAHSQEIKSMEEKVTHGNLLKPFAKYHTYICEVLPFYPMHWHKEMEVIRVLDGIGSFCINGEWYNASKGDIIFINPFENHSIQRYGDESMSIDAILFDIEMLVAAIPDMCSVKYLTPIISGEKSAPPIIRASSTLYRGFDESMTSIMYSVSGEEEGYELSLKANLMWLFYHLYRYNQVTPKRQVRGDKDNTMIRLALEYIVRNYSKEFSVSSLAAECGYSETHLMKLFKKYTGITCIEYINNFRLNRAGEKLMSTDDQIIDIAYDCGYSNISYFNKLFKQSYGVTPREFRRQNRA